jgi:hypothetical protein
VPSKVYKFKGKTSIVKHFLLAQMGFETEMRGIPEKYKTEVNDLIWKFLFYLTVDYFAYKFYVYF